MKNTLIFRVLHCTHRKVPLLPNLLLPSLRLRRILELNKPIFKDGDAYRFVFGVHILISKASTGQSGTDAMMVEE
jgi:hypothetical protein